MLPSLPQNRDFQIRRMGGWHGLAAPVPSQTSPGRGLEQWSQAPYPLSWLGFLDWRVGRGFIVPLTLLCSQPPGVKWRSSCSLLPSCLSVWGPESEEQAGGFASLLRAGPGRGVRHIFPRLGFPCYSTALGIGGLEQLLLLTPLLDWDNKEQGKGAVAGWTPVLLPVLETFLAVYFFEKFLPPETNVCSWPVSHLELKSFCILTRSSQILWLPQWRFLHFFFLAEPLFKG